MKENSANLNAKVAKTPKNSQKSANSSAKTTKSTKVAKSPKFQKFTRTKYIRNLEKFYNAAVSGLKRENFDKEIFAQRMQKNAEIFDKCEAAELNSAYLKDLQGFVNACLAPKCDKQGLLAKANALDKLKNAKKKGEKHKKNARNYDSSDI